MNDPQIDSFYVCERCNHVFDWKYTQYRRDLTASDGARICPKCKTEFVRKFRVSDQEQAKK